MFVFLTAPGNEEAAQQQKPALRAGTYGTSSGGRTSDGGTSVNTEDANEKTSETLETPKEMPTTDTAKEDAAAADTAKASEEAAAEETKEAEQLEETISKAITDVDEAEEEEIQANQGMLTQSIKMVEDMVKFGLGKLFGDGMDIKEMAEIADEVSTRLEDEAQEEFRVKADLLADKKAEEIEDVVEVDEDVGIKSKDIRQDVKQVEHLAVSNLKDEIDDAAQNVKDHLKEKAVAIENEIVNAHLEKNQSGVKVKVEGGELVKNAEPEIKGNETKTEETKSDEKKEETKEEPKKEETKPDEKKEEEKKEETKSEEKKEEEKKEEEKKEDTKSDDKKDEEKKEETKSDDKKEETKTEEKKDETKSEEKKEEPKEVEKKEEAKTEVKEEKKDEAEEK
jgi:hypothetical protein